MISDVLFVLCVLVWVRLGICFLWKWKKKLRSVISL